MERRMMVPKITKKMQRVIRFWLASSKLQGDQLFLVSSLLFILTKIVNKKFHLTLNNILERFSRNLYHFIRMNTLKPISFHLSWSLLLLYRAFENDTNMLALENHISDKSYMTGHQPALTDATIYSLLSNISNIERNTNVCDEVLLHASRVTLNYQIWRFLS